MKKFSKYLALFLLPFVCIGLWHIRHTKISSAQTYGGLIINTGVPDGQPIFSVHGFMPGDCETKTISVSNTQAQQDLTVRSANVLDNGGIAETMQIKISENDLVYQQTLAGFFTESNSIDGIVLGSINHGQTKAFSIEVCFDESAGNEFQNKQVVFDLIFGNVISPFPLPAECSHLRGVVTSVINGKDKTERINGTSASELIFGNGGNDRIDGGAGHDCIVVEDGNDRIDGGSGNDVIVASNGVNRIEGGAGNDFIYAGDGNDRINGDSGDDTIFSGGGNDTINGDSGHDTIIAGEGNDRINGDTGDDKLYGQGGNDRANGGTGQDICEAEIKSKCEL